MSAPSERFQLESLEIPPAARAQAGASGPLLASRSFRTVLLAMVSFGYAFSSFLLLPKYLTLELDASAAQIGRVTAVSGVAAMLALLVCGVAVDRWGRRRFLTGGALLMAASSLAFGLVDEVGPLLYGLRIAQSLALDGALGAEDLVGQVLGGVLAGVAHRLIGWASSSSSGTARVAVRDGRAARVAEARVGRQVGSAVAARYREGSTAAAAKPRPLAILPPARGTRHDKMIDVGAALRFLNPEACRTDPVLSRPNPVAFDCA